MENNVKVDLFGQVVLPKMVIPNLTKDYNMNVETEIIETAEQKTEREKSWIQTFGAMEYPTETCLILLEWDTDFMIEQINNENSDFNKWYTKGKVINEFQIDISLLKSAREGDMKAIEMLDKRRNARLIQ